MDGSTTSVRNFSTSAFLSWVSPNCVATMFRLLAGISGLYGQAMRKTQGDGQYSPGFPERGFCLPRPAPHANCAALHPMARALPLGEGEPSGRSSGVEHNLAKVGVGRSNRLAHSIHPPNCLARNLLPSSLIPTAFVLNRLSTFQLVQPFGSGFGKLLIYIVRECVFRFRLG